MYNGVGVATPRGTGTSGYVESSLVVHKSTPQKHIKSQPKIPKKSQTLIEHEKRREVELRCLELKKELLKKGKTEEQIAKIINIYREDQLNPPPPNAILPNIPLNIKTQNNTGEIKTEEKQIQ